MFDWVDILESKLDSMSPVGTDLETVKQQIVELKVGLAGRNTAVENKTRWVTSLLKPCYTVMLHRLLSRPLLGRAVLCVHNSVSRTIGQGLCCRSVFDF